jgi:hypothetical protein
MADGDPILGGPDSSPGGLAPQTDVVIQATVSDDPLPQRVPPPRYSLAELCLYFVDLGALVAGPLGAVVAALGVFLPCYLFVIVPAPYFRRIAANLQVKAFVDGVTAAATGAIAGAAAVLGRRAVFEAPTAFIALASLAILIRTKRVPEPVLILAAGIIGLSIH